MPSPHFVVKFNAFLARPPVARVRVRFRKIPQIDPEEFRSDILSSKLSEPCNDLNEYVSRYNSALSVVLDKHAPLITRSITPRPNSPWYNENLHSLKRAKHAAERKWRKSGLTVHKQILSEKIKVYKEALDASK